MISRGAPVSPDNGSDGSDVITIERFTQLTTLKIRFGSYIVGE